VELLSYVHYDLYAVYTMNTMKRDSKTVFRRRRKDQSGIAVALVGVAIVAPTRNGCALMVDLCGVRH
jgi:hypothetical protein